MYAESLPILRVITLVLALFPFSLYAQEAHYNAPVLSEGYIFTDRNVDELQWIDFRENNQEHWEADLPTYQYRFSYVNRARDFWVLPPSSRKYLRTKMENYGCYIEPEVFPKYFRIVNLSIEVNNLNRALDIDFVPGELDSRFRIIENSSSVDSTKWTSLDKELPNRVVRNPGAVDPEIVTTGVTKYYSLLICNEKFTTCDSIIAALRKIPCANGLGGFPFLKEYKYLSSPVIVLPPDGKKQVKYDIELYANGETVLIKEFMIVTPVDSEDAEAVLLQEQLTGKDVVDMWGARIGKKIIDATGLDTSRYSISISRGRTSAELKSLVDFNFYLDSLLTIENKSSYNLGNYRSYLKKQRNTIQDPVFADYIAVYLNIPQRKLSYGQWYAYDRFGDLLAETLESPDFISPKQFAELTQLATYFQPATLPGAFRKKGGKQSFADRDYQLLLVDLALPRDRWLSVVVEDTCNSYDVYAPITVPADVNYAFANACKIKGNKNCGRRMCKFGDFAFEPVTEAEYDLYAVNGRTGAVNSAPHRVNARNGDMKLLDYTVFYDDDETEATAVSAYYMRVLRKQGQRSSAFDRELTEEEQALAKQIQKALEDVKTIRVIPAKVVYKSCPNE